MVAGEGIEEAEAVEGTITADVVAAETGAEEATMPGTGAEEMVEAGTALTRMAVCVEAEVETGTPTGAGELELELTRFGAFPSGVKSELLVRLMFVHVAVVVSIDGIVAAATVAVVPEAAILERGVELESMAVLLTRLMHDLSHRSAFSGRFLRH